MSETAVRSVSVGDEEGVFTVAFETVANDGVIFQLADRVDDQDATLGMDSYSVSLASGATVYGGVADAMREELVLVLSWHEDAALALGLPGELRLRLPDESSIETAVAGLRRVGIAAYD